MSPTYQIALTLYAIGAAMTLAWSYRVLVGMKDDPEVRVSSWQKQLSALLLIAISWPMVISAMALNTVRRK